MPANENLTSADELATVLSKNSTESTKKLQTRDDDGYIAIDSESDDPEGKKKIFAHNRLKVNQRKTKKGNFREFYIDLQEKIALQEELSFGGSSSPSKQRKKKWKKVLINGTNSSDQDSRPKIKIVRMKASGRYNN